VPDSPPARLDADPKLAPLLRDARGSARCYFRRPPPTQCSPAAPLECRGAVLYDVSAGGAGLFTEEEIPPGAVLTLQLPTREGTDSVMLRACVIHATARAPGLWLIGCLFAHPLTAAQLRRVLSAGRTGPHGGEGT
jgi:hypothetical protein